MFLSPIVSVRERRPEGHGCDIAVGDWAYLSDGIDDILAGLDGRM